MNRRQYLHHMAALAALTLINGRVWAVPDAAQASGNRLLVVMLRGAYDGNSLLVPHGFPFYYAARPNIAIPHPQSGQPDSAIDIGHGYGLHPVLRDSVWPLFQRRQLAFVPFSGSGDMSRSHFEAQDLMELGVAPGPHLDESSGFLERLVQVLRDSHRPAGGIAFTNNLPLSFKGPHIVPNIALNGNVQTLPDNAETERIKALYAGSALDSYLLSGMRTRAEIAATLGDMQQSARGAAHPDQFVAMTGKMARLMRDDPRYGIAFVDLGGWDSHINQGAAQGMLASHLDQLGKGLRMFADTMGDAAWRHTVVVVMSEFGRTFRENGTRGTDHGHGNTLWVLGGSIQGGRLAGEMGDLNEASLFQQRDTPILNDYRSVLANLMQRMYALDDRALEQVFPRVTPHEFALL